MSLVPFNIPTNKVQHAVYSGTTNASGEFSVVYIEPYLVAPVVLPVILPNGAAERTVRVSANSTTGFTVKVEQRSSINLLGADVLLATTTNVSGATVSVVVIQ